MTITEGSNVDVFDGAEQLVFECCGDIFELAPLSCVFGVMADDGIVLAALVPPGMAGCCPG